MKHRWWFWLMLLFIIMTGCAGGEKNDLEKVGLLLSHPIDDQGWNSKAYQGMLNIQSSLGVDVYIKEDVQTMSSIMEAVNELHDEGVNLIFGHGILYADYFMDLKRSYPDVHFVSFNGEVSGENITSLHFKGYAMGYFAGMLSSKMSETNTVGVIAAFPFQPEVDGFKDGASFQNDDIEVMIEFVESWVDEEKAVEYFRKMKSEGADVFYPAGDGYHVTVVEEVKNEGLYAIGYVGDHIDLGESTILTSTVQRVEKLYEYVAEAYKQGELDNGNLYFDFSEGVITLGEYSSEVPEEVVQWIETHIERYIETGKFPHEK
ncbi:BMP family ABC transporter substrate-binding protein [Bacillus shivajii]|uniref:BMP family ABC transporter substrate-binding protein n=1 Tax=Bacillus shivajii TaxID=1983719 RepID=UPI001CFA6957|nr:BMP family ABC transporter substrate-binding protein [Bacillus shivajii]UCZ51972.1 BMP family ABC transporter substrate-binding protein [Bacillus shivajii]